MAARTTGGAGRASSTSTRSGSAGSGTVARTASSRATTTARTASTSGARVSRADMTLNKVVSVTPTTTDKVMELEDNTGLLYIGTSANANRGATTGASRISIREPVGTAAKLRTSTTNRASSIRMSSMGVSTNQVDVTTTQDMDELAELTDYCKAQYAACMDNYCNVLDDNQGRCSCSANLKNYEKSEAALKAATEELQEVAQKIQYIGLSAREVETLFSQTEAELKMQSTTDTSQLKTSLDKIKDMIIEVQSGNTTSNTSGLVFDLSGLLDFTIDSTGFDLSSFLGGFGGGNGGVSNQRGSELFKTATNRCKANVLKACVNQGVDASLVTNAYDLEIDKECIEYERNLNDSNDQMVATVRNAKNVLQKARLLVEQSKNEYDMRGCINALDACMQDEYVCGSDYEKCLDPSGRYIVNGEIVIGTDPGRAVNGVSGGVDVLDGDICSMNLYNVWNYGSSTPGQTNTSQSGCKNAWNSYSLNGSSNGNLSEYISQTLGDHDGLGMSQFIQNKIGYYDSKTDKNYGMCMSVLNKCQDYTYDVKGNKRTYNKKNEVVKQYLDRILIQIKARQDELLSEHAESCITDVTTCLSQNNYPFDEVSENSVQANIAINACRSTIVTCMSVNGYSVDDPTPSDLWPWICGITTGSTDCVPNSGGGSTTEVYTVSFDCIGNGWGSVASITQSRAGASITLPAHSCTPTDSVTQIGWRLPSVMGGGVKHAGDTIKPTGNITIDAVYSGYGITLNANYTGGTNKTLYWADKKWYSDTARTQQITSVPTNMQITRNGYKLRGFTNTKQTSDITGNNQSTNLENDLVIKNNWSFTSIDPQFTVYAAWAKDCENTTYCDLQISEDTGYVTYVKQGNCPSGNWSGEGTYTMTCAGENDLAYYSFPLNDNCDSGHAVCATHSAPSTIYYVYQKGNSSYTNNKWYGVTPSTSNTNPTQIPGITVPTSSNNYTFSGFYDCAIMGGNHPVLIQQNGTINTNWTPTGNESLCAGWDEPGGGDTPPAVVSNHNRTLTFTDQQ